MTKKNKLSRKKWSIESVYAEALKYKTRNQFQKNAKGAYLKALRLKILNEVCSHLPKDSRIGNQSLNRKWTKKTLSVEAFKYVSRTEFESKNLGAYSAALKTHVIDDICKHMKRLCRKKYSQEEIVSEAKRYFKRVDFRNNSSGAYQAAKYLKILDRVCAHMAYDTTSSSIERKIAKYVESLGYFQEKLRKRKISIPEKSWITGFDIDIFIPGQNIGIEFDGNYYHSFSKMRADAHKQMWPDEDIYNYDSIKDSFFLRQHGIQILHIKEKEWLLDSNSCLSKISNFLRGGTICK